MSSLIGASPKAALLLMDCQNGFYHATHWGLQRSNPSFEQNLGKLLKLFRAQHLPILHVVHHSLSPESPLHPSRPDGIAFIPCAMPQDGEPVIIKNVNSGFIGTDLEETIRAEGINMLFVAGLETDRCVSTSIRMAANLGVVGKKGVIYIVADATANFERGKWDAETVHAVHIASLKGEFAEVATVTDVERIVGACA